MGILGKLTGWDKTMAAQNAVMANHVLQICTAEEKLTITEEVVKIISSVQRGIDKREILSTLSKENRVIQLNFVALACDNLYIKEPFKKSAWTRLSNPYIASAGVDDFLIQATISAINKDDSTKIEWPGIEKSIDFNKLINLSSLSEADSNLGEEKKSTLDDLEINTDELSTEIPPAQSIFIPHYVPFSGGQVATKLSDYLITKNGNIFALQNIQKFNVNQLITSGERLDGLIHLNKFNDDENENKPIIDTSGQTELVVYINGFPCLASRLIFILEYGDLFFEYRFEPDFFEQGEFNTYELFQLTAGYPDLNLFLAPEKIGFAEWCGSGYRNPLLNICSASYCNRDRLVTHIDNDFRNNKVENLTLDLFNNSDSRALLFLLSNKRDLWPDFRPELYKPISMLNRHNNPSTWDLQATHELYMDTLKNFDNTR